MVMALHWTARYLFFAILFHQAVRDNAEDLFTEEDYDGAFTEEYEKVVIDVLGYHPITYDTATVTVYNEIDRNFTFFLQSSQCHKCKLIKIKVMEPNSEVMLGIDTAWSVSYAISSNKGQYISPNDESIFCKSSFHFGENGNYSVRVEFNATDKESTCKVTMMNPPQDSNIPIYVALGIYALMALVYCVYVQLSRSGWLNQIFSCFSMDKLINDDLGAPPPPLTTADRTAINNQSKAKSRVKSLDTFRGISIIVMIFVNYGGGQYWFFVHSKWNGLTVADLAFPWFMFIMGASIKLSQAILYRHGFTRWKIFKKILRRTIILFVLGCLLDGGIDLTYYRFPGVLQRFAVAYGVVAVLQLASLRPRNEDRLGSRAYRLFSDIIDYWYEWIFAIVLMLIYLGVTFFWQPSGCPEKGYLGPGGPLVEGKFSHCTGGAQGALDRWFFGPKHIYQTPTCQAIYKTEQPYDPEGILGSITTILMTYFGLQASKILHVYQSHSSRLIRFVIWGVCLGSIGTLLCKASRDDGWFPVNKNLWSPSFVTATAGLAFILLAICYILIDVKGWWSGAPFYYAGMNSILIYIGHELVVDSTFPFSWKPFHGTHAELLAMNLIGVSLWVIISIWLYHIQFFLKI